MPSSGAAELHNVTHTLRNLDLLSLPSPATPANIFLYAMYVMSLLQLWKMK